MRSPVIIVDFRQIRIGKDVCQPPPLRADLRFDLAVLLAAPATVPPVLVLPIFRIADTRLGFDVVEPGIFHALAIGPHILAGDRAGMTPDALVEIEYHRNLRADFHSAASIAGSTVSAAG